MSTSPHHNPAFETKQESGEKSTQPKPPSLTISVTGRKYGRGVETVCVETQNRTGKALSLLSGWTTAGFSDRKPKQTENPKPL